jgi:hypothetical protein
MELKHVSVENLEIETSALLDKDVRDGACHAPLRNMLRAVS